MSVWVRILSSFPVCLLLVYCKFGFFEQICKHLTTIFLLICILTKGTQVEPKLANGGKQAKGEKKSVNGAKTTSDSRAVIVIMLQQILQAKKTFMPISALWLTAFHAIKFEHFRAFRCPLKITNEIGKTICFLVLLTLFPKLSFNCLDAIVIFPTMSTFFAPVLSLMMDQPIQKKIH